MCGPSMQEKAITDSSQNFMSTLQQNYNTNEALQGAALSHINSVLEPILAAGPNQRILLEEKAALNTQAIDTTGAAAKNEEVAAQTQGAGMNDEGNLPQSGIDQAIEARTRSSAENQLSSEQLGITEADYATGRSEFGTALSGEESLAGLYSPNAAAGNAVNQGESAFKMADTVSNEENQKQQAIASGATSLALGVAGGFAGGFGNLDSTGGSTGGEQLGNFASGFASGFGG